MSGRNASGGGTRYNDRYRSDTGGASSGTKRPYRADEGSASHRSPTRYPPSKTGRGGGDRDRGGGGGGGSERKSTDDGRSSGRGGGGGNGTFVLGSSHKDSSSRGGLDQKHRDHMAEVHKLAEHICGDWSEHVSSSGKRYYYNVRTMVSQWDRPKEWTIDTTESSQSSRTARPLDSKDKSSNYLQLKPSSRRDVDSQRHADGAGDRAPPTTKPAPTDRKAPSTAQHRPAPGQSASGAPAASYRATRDSGREADRSWGGSGGSPSDRTRDRSMSDRGGDDPTPLRRRGDDSPPAQNTAAARQSERIVGAFGRNGERGAESGMYRGEQRGGERDRVEERGAERSGGDRGVERGREGRGRVEGGAGNCRVNGTKSPTTSGRDRADARRASMQEDDMDISSPSSHAGSRSSRSRSASADGPRRRRSRSGSSVPPPPPPPASGGSASKPQTGGVVDSSRNARGSDDGPGWGDRPSGGCATPRNTPLKGMTSPSGAAANVLGQGVGGGQGVGAQGATGAGLGADESTVMSTLTALQQALSLVTGAGKLGAADLAPGAPPRPMPPDVLSTLALLPAMITQLGSTAPPGPPQGGATAASHSSSAQGGSLCHSQGGAQVTGGAPASPAVGKGGGQQSERQQVTQQAIQLLQKLQQALMAQQQQQQQQRQLQQLLLQLLSVQKSNQSATPVLSSVPPMTLSTTPTAASLAATSSSSPPAIKPNGANAQCDRVESPYSPPDSDGTPLGTPEYGPAAAPAGHHPPPLALFRLSSEEGRPTGATAGSPRFDEHHRSRGGGMHAPGPRTVAYPPHHPPIVVLSQGGATSQLAGAVSALRKGGVQGAVWGVGGGGWGGGLTPSLGNHVNPRLVEHVTGWPTDFLERQASCVAEESHAIAALHSTQVSVELKRARSLVRVDEIHSTLQEQRVMFLRQLTTELGSYSSSAYFTSSQDI